MPSSHTSIHRVLLPLAFFLGLSSGLSCAAGDPEPQELGTASLHVLEVPAGVACIRIRVTCVRTLFRYFDVAPGQSAVLQLSQLPAGLVAFQGEAFPSSCATVSARSTPTWVTDPVVTNVAPRASLPVAFFFRSAGQASLCVGWRGDPTSVRLTSITLDAENANGETLNSVDWTTSTGDPLSQMLAIRDGIQLNQMIATLGPGSLGEIDVPLNAGLNTLTLVASELFPTFTHFGAVLFFDGQQTPPQIAVYNANAGTGPFSVQPAGTQVVSCANGGLFFDPAPGTSTYTAADGSTVEVVSFSIDSISGGPDLVNRYYLRPDGQPDTTATLVLRVTPACR